VSRKHTLDVVIGVYDAAALFNDALDNPKKYGFKNGISQGDSRECIWRDSLHPTMAMHKVVAADVIRFLTRKYDQEK